MDQFIRDYDNKLIETLELDNVDQFNDTFKENDLSKSFSIYHNNIRSIQKNFDQFEVYMTQFHKNFNCIVLTETWNIADKDFFRLEGYEIIESVNKINQNDGIAIYIRKDFTDYEYKNIKIGITNAINLEIKINKYKINILAIYRSPSTSEYDFVDNLSELLNTYNFNSFDHFFIIGDINIDINGNRGNLDYAGEYLNLLSEKGFISLINKNTRVTDTSATCIDHIFLKSRSCTSTESVISAIIKTNITDHYSVISKISYKEISNYTKQHFDESYKKINNEKLIQLLSSVSWDMVYSCLDPNEAFDKFFIIFSNCISKSTQFIKLNPIKRKKPWITQGLVISIKNRDKLFQKHLRHPQNEQFKLEYITHRNKLNCLIKKAKYSYFKSKIDCNKNCAKTLWNVVKDFSNNYKNEDKNIDKIITENEDEVIDPEEIGNKFNIYFSQIGEKLASKIVQEPMVNEIVNFPHSMYINYTNVAEIKQIVLELKNNKAPGPDGIKNELLKSTIDIIVEPLCFIINKCIECGKFPTHFKKATIRPVFKGGSKTDVSNYRPISLTSSFAKLFEKIIKLRLVDYLNKNKVLSNMQFGFQKDLSTQDAIAKVTSIIYDAIDSKRACLGVFVDLAKAFDTVSHGLLLEKLENLGIRGNVLKLFKSFLEERKQKVEIKNVLSKEQTVTCGVPQGTVLGPVLFTIYLNSLFTLNSSGTIISFADDTVILYTGHTWDEVRHLAERGLKKIFDWFNANLLTVNVNKTKIIPFTSYEKYLPDYSTISVNNLLISLTRSIKYLGVFIDSYLRWNIHVNNIITKIRGLMFKFYQCRQILPLSHLKILYYAFIESIMQYGIIGWGGVRKTYLIPLEIIQKKILKIIYFKSFRYPTEQLFSELNILNLRQLYAKSILLFLFRNKQYVIRINHEHNTREQDAAHLTIPRTHKSIGQRYFVYFGPKLLNILPISLINIKTKHLFKKKLKAWITSNDGNLLYNIFDPM